MLRSMLGACIAGLVCLFLPLNAFGELKAVLVAQGFSRPVFVIGPPGDSERLFVLEQTTGRIQIVKNGAISGTLLTVPDIHTRPDGKPFGEEGLLAMAFHPNFYSNRRFYLYYNTPGPTVAGYSVVAEYTISASDPDQADPEPRIILRYPRINVGEFGIYHNGGALNFGPDGYLYIPTGDTSRAENPQQLVDDQGNPNLEGKVLRIDVNRDDFPEDPFRNYGIPANNPFRHIPGAGEIWAVGLRNPWRASFDRLTGDYYIADVGLDTAEEVNYQPSSSLGGENYGWPCVEADLCAPFTDPGCSCLAPTLTPPIAVYHHEDGCSVIGGYVYRGSAIPELYGRYVYGDFCTGRIWSFRVENGQAVDHLEHTAELTPAIGPRINRISSFGQDDAGELYVVDLTDGEIFKIVRDPELPASPPSDSMQDSDGDGVSDCEDGCAHNPTKTEPGFCGCLFDDVDSDGDGVPDCLDGCINDPEKADPGLCGCGLPDTDSDGDLIPDCLDNCPAAYNPEQIDTDGDGVGDVCESPEEDKSSDPGQQTPEEETDAGDQKVPTLQCLFCGVGCTLTVVLCVPGLGLLRVVQRRRRGV